jgi:hypothetical protein
MKMVTVEFYTMAVGGGVKRVLESRRMPRFADEESFILWAQIALPNRRSDPNIEEWPEAVRAVNQSGNELFRWSPSDQSQA